MTREEALALLRVGAEAERIEAAVVLRSQGRQDDLPRVRRAALRELDERVRVELLKTRMALEEVGSAEAGQTDERLSDTETRADAYARAVQDTTFEIVHELRRLVGFARGSAAGEIDGFSYSRTRADFDRLSALLNAVERLGEVAGIPYSEEFDLGGLVHDLAARVLLEHPRQSPTENDDNGSPQESTEEGDENPYSIEIELLGPQPLLIRSDSALIELAARNGLLNAVEASLGIEEAQAGPPTVVMNWGTTDVDSWLTILDNGPGLSDRIRDPFQFAKTTKRAHLGVGLTITRRAVTSLGGRVLLQSRPDRGALFEVRWPHDRTTL